MGSQLANRCYGRPTHWSNTHSLHLHELDLAKRCPSKQCPVHGCQSNDPRKTEMAHPRSVGASWSMFGDWRLDSRYLDEAIWKVRIGGYMLTTYSGFPTFRVSILRIRRDNHHRCILEFGLGQRLSQTLLQLNINQPLGRYQKCVFKGSIGLHVLPFRLPLLASHLQ